MLKRFRLRKKRLVRRSGPREPVAVGPHQLVPVPVSPWTAKKAAELADAAEGDGISAGDVLDIAVAHLIEMMAAVGRSGIDAASIDARTLPELYYEARKTETPKRRIEA